MSYARNVIEAMGGPSKVAEMIEGSVSTVHSWTTNGFPPSRLRHLKLEAKEAGIEIDWSTGMRVEHAESDTGEVSGSADRNAADHSTLLTGSVA